MSSKQNPPVGEEGTPFEIACYCGSSLGTLIRSEIRGGKRQPIVRCSECGVVQKGTVNSDEHETFHREGKQAAEINLDSMSEEYAQRNLTDVTRRVNALCPFLDDETTLLDFGTGMGHFIDAVQPHVDTVVGSEINRDRLAFVRDKLGFDVYEGTEPLRSEFDDERFDIVTMFHVLEHLPNPLEQLREVRRLLNDDGRLIVEVPNHDDWLLSRCDDYADFYYQDAHAYYFDPRTLTEVLTDGGFDSRVIGVQRYGYRNALNWLLEGEPELNTPSRHRDTWRAPVDKLYGELVTRLRRSDTIFAVCHRS